MVMRAAPIKARKPAPEGDIAVTQLITAPCDSGTGDSKGGVAKGVATMAVRSFRRLGGVRDAGRGMEPREQCGNKMREPEHRWEQKVLFPLEKTVMIYAAYAMQAVRKSSTWGHECAKHTNAYEI